MIDYNTFDIALVLIVFFGALYGSYRGFVVTLLSFAGKILSAILAGKFLGKFIEVFRVKELFLNDIGKILQDYLPVSEEIKNMKLSEEGVNLAGSSFEGNNLIKILGENISREIKRFSEMGDSVSFETVGDMISLVVSNYILNILSFIFLFLLFLFGFSILKAIMVNLISSSGAVTGVDKIFGFILGAGVNVFVLALFIGISYDLLNVTALEEGGILSTYRIMLNESSFRAYFSYVYNLIINEGIKLL